KIFFITATRGNEKLNSLLSELCASSESSSGRESKEKNISRPGLSGPRAAEQGTRKRKQE
ncbi:hypothetical protein, partial [Desulfonatronospira sp. MSAO_Bac3]|uniref:hypothetical protein n=1 Tax=Desulfonatronospira sp. MSAO_Bac3 TaxID=2293857 RepID=UPI000FF429B2